jgi:hypothetical protein
MVNNRFLVNQIEGEMKRLFSEEIIDMTDYDGKKNNQKKDALNSRSIAAYALHILAEVGVNMAAESIVDGYEDNGIDALLFHRDQNVLWLVQAKWINDGQSSPSTGDLRKFKDGISDLLSFDHKSDRFNAKFSIKKEEIESALRSPGLKIKIVVAYTGPELSKHANHVLEDCLEEMNDIDGDLASVEVFDLTRAYQALTDKHKHENIDVDVSLLDWGRIDEPYEAFYGRVNASEAAKWWIQHRGKLFAKNIREFIGESTVNDEIKLTLENEPALFWYFNNGITVLCENIARLDASKGANRKEGLFRAKGISVINGAQTIGSIGQIYQRSSSEQREQLEQVEIFVKFISLDACSAESGLGAEDFALKVTRATNTQNKVEVRDFVALDPQQERLSKEFKSNGRVYHYKRKAELFCRDEKNYDLEEATITLACSHDDVNLAMLVKQDLNKLWADTSKYPYTAIFKPSVNVVQLWRQIEIKRFVESKILQLKEKDTKSTKEALLRHGDVFLLALVFKQIEKNLFSIEISEEVFHEFVSLRLEELVDKVVELSADFVDKNSKPNSRWRIFSTAAKLRELQNFVVKHK